MQLSHQTAHVLENIAYSKSTVHMFTLSICTEPTKVLYTRTPENSSHVHIIPYTPLFVVPRFIDPQANPMLHAIAGHAHDLYVPPSEKGYDLVAVRTALNIRTTATIQTDTTYTITSVDVDTHSLIIPGNNFLTGDTIRIERNLYTIQDRDGDTITLNTDAPVTALWKQKPVRLVVDVNEDPMDALDVPRNTMHLLGVIGHIQPDDAHLYATHISVASVVQGYTPLAMSETDCQHFQPGSHVYLVLETAKDCTECILSYRPKAPIATDTIQYAYMGLFIESSLTANGIVAYICLTNITPAKFWVPRALEDTN